MVNHSCYWFETVPPTYSINTGIIKNAEIVIIGGGMSGMLLLATLLHAGFDDICLIEEQSIGFHASGRNSGQLLFRGHKLFHELEKDIGYNNTLDYLMFMLQNNRQFLSAIQDVNFDTDLQHCGGLRLAINEEELESLKRESYFLKDFISCPILDADAIRKFIPSKKFIGGMYVPNEATFNPYKVVSNIANNFKEYLLTNSCVEYIENNKDGSFGVNIRNKGVIKAKKIVYCNNTYVNFLVPELSKYILPIRHQMLATGMFENNFFPSFAMTCNNGNEYFRMHGSRLLLGGMRESIRGSQENIIFDGEISQTITNNLKDFLSSIFDDITFPVTHVWSGITCRTSDGLPFVGRLPNKHNQFVMAGFDQYGFSHIFLASVIIKEILLKGYSTIFANHLFDPKRFLNV